MLLLYNIIHTRKRMEMKKLVADKKRRYRRTTNTGTEII